MSINRSLILVAGILLSLITCITSYPAAESTAPAATDTLIACDEATAPVLRSILPAFTPAYPCELENAYNHIDFCMVHASPEVSYPCSQTESIQEIVIGAANHTVLIQRDKHVSAGCWHGISFDTRSIRVCDRGSGESTMLAEDVLGGPLPSPDGVWLAFVATESEYSLEPHIFRTGLDGTDLVRLDTQPFPQDQVVGAQILRWSEDGKWLEVSLWDGREGSYRRYRIRSDGSGEFEILP